MRIHIDEISGDGSVVRFTYGTGHGDGVWRGDGHPKVGPVDVEWEIPGRFYWGDDLRLWHDDGARQIQDTEAFSIAGVAMAIDDRGTLSLNMGDGLVNLVTAGPPPKNLVGVIVEVDAPLIELFPVR